MKHIMVDIETLDTRDSAVVISIGAVKFDTENLGEVFYTVLDVELQLKAGRTISASTLAWWMQQDAKAKTVFVDISGTALIAANKFSQFAGFFDHDDYQVWGNGAVFDNAILTNLHNTFTLKRPWSYKNDRCYRTLRAYAHEAYPWLTNMQPLPVTAHNALDDAIAQALHLQQIWAALGGALTEADT